MGNETTIPIEDVFFYCRHDNCDYYIRFNGEKRRIALSGYLAPGSRIVHKCPSCRQTNTFEVPLKSEESKEIDKPKVDSVESLLRIGQKHAQA